LIQLSFTFHFQRLLKFVLRVRLCRFYLICICIEYTCVCVCIFLIYFIEVPASASLLLPNIPELELYPMIWSSKRKLKVWEWKRSLQFRFYMINPFQRKYINIFSTKSCECDCVWGPCVCPILSPPFSGHSIFIELWTLLGHPITTNISWYEMYWFGLNYTHICIHYTL
jgi:hypothetical protein